MNYRVDIQALRGIAVLLVVLYHAKLPNIPGGYLGVDIFFVISGFLITTQIVRLMDVDAFSFKEFYLRRAWRLLPAAYVVFGICIIAAPWLLTNSEINDLKEQLFGAISFTANIALWMQTGYFEDAAELKPLLHTWSLSIEEQYYLAMPLLLYLLPKKHWLLITATLTLISLGLMMALIVPMPGAVFYLTPTRVWELGIGSILALLIARGYQAKPTYLAWLGVAVIVILPFKLLVITEHTEFNNLLITLATAFVVAGRLPFLTSTLAAKLLAQVGTISYSLYLVHWPIFAFINSANLGDDFLSWKYRALALVTSFILATILYRLVETRWRITTPSNSIRIWPLVLISCALLMSSLAFNTSSDSNSHIDYAHEYRVNTGLSTNCSKTDGFFSAECETSEQAKTLIWGDSFAMHVSPGLKAFSQGGIRQAARSSCAPLTSIAYYDPPLYGQAWATNCLRFNRAVMQHITNTSSLEMIVLGSPWNYLLGDREYASYQEHQFKLVDQSPHDIFTELKKLVKQLQDLGKKVVVLAPPPSSNFNIGKCHQRKAANIISFQGTPNCDFLLADSYQHNQLVVNLMQSLEEHDIPVYKYASKLCDDDRCNTAIGDTVLYRDSGHLSIRGSEIYAQRFNLYQELLEIAR